MESDDSTLDLVTYPGSAADRQLVMSLVILHRNGVRTVPLSPGNAVTIGRAPPVDILVTDNTLSRQHARFELVGNQVIVKDLNSRNGVWVNNERIQHHALIPGNEVSMGRIVVSVQLLNTSENPVHRLISHDQFVAMLDEEVSKARTFGSRLAVVHLEASPKEAKVSQWFGMLGKFLRPVDMIALYSNTAVVIFLPDAGEQEAQHLARLILHQRGPENRLTPGLRFGISTYPASAATADELLQASRRAIRRTTDQERIKVAPPQRFRKVHDSEPVRPVTTLAPVVGSPAMQEVFAAVERLSQTDIPVLLLGETGTGKEVVARAIHEGGKRRSKALCCINCASIPEQLVESTLFGHVRGAFTGADRDAKGVFEEADGGTVLLDEIAELPQPTQAKLLRVLETKQVSRVGSAKERSMDVRIIAATHRNLEEMCESDQFRWDLFYRINTMTLKIPPLRDRPEEIPLLVDHFISQTVQDSDSRISVIGPDALRLLEGYHWPGNVRELRNVIERAVVLAQGETITVEDLPERVRLYHAGSGDAGDDDRLQQKETLHSIRSIRTPRSPSSPAPPDDGYDQDSVQNFKDRVQQFEAQLIREALQRTGGNQTEAARQLGIPLRSLVRKVKSYGL